MRQAPRLESCQRFAPRRLTFDARRFPFAAISDFASLSENPQATSDKAAMSAISDFAPSFETPASFVGRVDVFLESSGSVFVSSFFVLHKWFDPSA
jgi:hypothetical protein